MKRATLILVTLGLLVLSIADRSQTSWLLVRALAFAVCLFTVKNENPRLLYGLAAAFTFIAIEGWRGFDYALASIAFCTLQVRLKSLAILLSAIGVAGGISLLLTHFAPGWPVAMFPFHNRNHFAVFCEISIPVLIYAARRSRNRIYLWVVGLIFVAALAGGSRAGAVLLTAEVCALWFLLAGRQRFWFAGPALALATSLFLLVAGTERIQNPLAGDHRIEIWQSSVEMIAAKPVRGWGSGEFSRIYPAYARFDNGEFVNAAHSDWVEWATEMGLPLSCAFLACFLWWTRKYIHFYPSWGILIGALHATVDYPFHLPGLLVFTAALAGSIEANGTSIEAESSNC